MNSIRRILVIRFRRVGDAVISGALCSTLKRTFPGAEIHYVLNEGIAPLFENHPDIDRIIRFNEQAMKSFSTYLSQVRQVVSEGKYDMIVDTRSTVKTLFFSLFSLPTPYRIGRKKPYNFWIQNFRTDNEGIVDEVNKILSLLKPVENKFKIQYQRDFRLYVSPEEKEVFRDYMRQNGIDFSKPIIVCAVTTRLAHKLWDPKRMKEILRRIIEKYNAQLIFNYGGKTEQEFACQMHREMNDDPAVFTRIEAKNLRELLALLANADFFFGNEGGPRHISQALQIPSFAIYPPGIDKAEWLPNASDSYQGIEPSDLSETGNDPSMDYAKKFDLISVDAVWKPLSVMLDRFLRK